MTKVTLDTRLECRHRPQENPIMHQDWLHLLFLHWEFDSKEIQKTLPPGLNVDTYNGMAYIGIVPFFLKNLRVFNLPALPGFSDFIEVNVRTYVFDQNGIPGIWFYSLDLNSLIGVQAARQAFALPYYLAELQAKMSKKIVEIQGQRVDQPNVTMDFNYSIANNLKFAEPDSLEFFLLERYFLFSFHFNELYRQQVHHQPYPFATTTSSEWKNGLFGVNGLKPPVHEPHILYSSEVNVDIFKIKKNIVFKNK